MKVEPNLRLKPRTFEDTLTNILIPPVHFKIAPKS